jgi:predicted GTPase
MNRRVKIYYMTQAAVAPPTFVLFTDRDVKLHFAFERFLANQIRAAFGFIGSPHLVQTPPPQQKASRGVRRHSTANCQAARSKSKCNI